MRIRIKQKCFSGVAGNMFAGETHDLPDVIAQKLIARGLAETDEAPKEPKRSNRSVGLKKSSVKLTTPEGDE
jgi:hypothetical protein